jgi:Aspartyl protease
MTYRFDPTQGLIVVSVRLFGPAGDTILRLALDTGATSTLTNSEIIVLLGYDPAASPDRIQVTTGSGVEFCPRVVVQRIEALGRSVKDFLILWISFAVARSA